MIVNKYCFNMIVSKYCFNMIVNKYCFNVIVNKYCFNIIVNKYCFIMFFGKQTLFQLDRWQKNIILIDCLRTNNILIWLKSITIEL